MDSMFDVVESPTKLVENDNKIPPPLDFYTDKQILLVIKLQNRFRMHLAIKKV